MCFSIDSKSAACIPEPELFQAQDITKQLLPPNPEVSMLHTEGAKWDTAWTAAVEDTTVERVTRQPFTQIHQELRLKQLSTLSQQPYFKQNHTIRQLTRSVLSAHPQRPFSMTKRAAQACSHRSGAGNMKLLATDRSVTDDNASERNLLSVRNCAGMFTQPLSRCSRTAPF
jgi:hypothetical protein